MKKKIEILGCKISILTSYEEVYNIIIDYISKTKSAAYITVNNVHSLIEAQKNESYKEIINNAFLALPDGKPLSIIAKMKGENSTARITGPTLFEHCLEWGQEISLKHLFFGSNGETLDNLERCVKQKYPKTQILKKITPPFRSFKPEENDMFIDQINRLNPDIIWVSLGAPKQEKWMAENVFRIERGLLVGVGAGFDYLAGNIRRAPKWMQDYSLEWLYRLYQEPRRLFKRYLISNTMFFYYLLKGYILKRQASN